MCNDNKIVHTILDTKHEKAGIDKICPNSVNNEREFKKWN